jgi:tetratricopeptide (TPR) repeat protein
MKRLILLCVAAAAAVIATPSLAQAPQGAPPGHPSIKPDKQDADTANTSLDKLFDRLAASGDADEAKGIARLIERRWIRSGSDTADLLMSRVVIAMTAQDQPLAIELLDRIIALNPGWAEAWNKRATVFYLMGDHQRSVADIRQTLALEPRHFGAWAGLGMIFYEADNHKAAVEAFRKALAIHPFVGDVRKMVERLAPDVDGRDL